MEKFISMRFFQFYQQLPGALSFKYALFLAGVLFACEIEKEIDYEIKQSSNKLIVRGVLHPEGAWVYVEPLSGLMNDNESESLDSVIVWLINENYESVELTRVDSLFFKTPASFLPTVQMKYYLKVTAPEFPVLTSSEQLVQPECVIDTAYIYDRSGDKMGIEFTDDVSASDFYAYKSDVYFNGDTYENMYYRSFLLPGNVMNDDVFNGQHYIILDNINLKERVRFDSILYADSAHLILYHISEDLFKYFENLSYIFPGYSDPYLDYPATVYSNIRGGYGIFGSYNADTVFIRLDTLLSNAIMSQKRSPFPGSVAH
jgi:hypothetical protein